MANKVRRSYPTEIDPTVDSYHDVPLWCVYGHEAFPQILACFVRMQPDLTIWGYSVYKRKPGYRTLGMNFREWKGRHDLMRFFDTQENAMEYLEELITPKCSVPTPR